MRSSIIKVENLSKFYKLGEFGTGTLVYDVHRWWSKVRGKEDPFTPINEIQDGINENTARFIWALNDVTFDVKRGEILGIIGSNGSGKSTLLKVLSRVTSPTKGKIKIRGRIASLLEVGTGFHPDLTGRENVFLNGAIMGMTKMEIRRKFDEIVDFAGVARHIDTPVKRYSSGMYVRLAFAIAAFLEPEILIVDEVLAVGDAEFQKKCLGRMKDLSEDDGRTVLFVSHNMQSITTLCSKAIWLKGGSIVNHGDVNYVVNSYMNNFRRKLLKQEWVAFEDAPGNKFLKILSVELVPDLPDPLQAIDVRTPLTVKYRFQNSFRINLSTDLLLFTSAGECIFDVATLPGIYEEGEWEGKCMIPGNFLNNGTYYFSIYFVKDSVEYLYRFENCLNFEVEDYSQITSWIGNWKGFVRPQFPYSLTKIDPGVTRNNDHGI